jgi:hypothetical protein
VTRRRRSKIKAVTLIAVALGVALAAPASAANLTRHDAQDIARDAARIECQRIAGCQTFRAFDVKKVSRLKAVGTIEVISVLSGVRQSCTRKLTMRLDAHSGKVDRSLNKRRCVDTATAD